MSHQPKGMPVLTSPVGGRPTKRTPEVEEKLFDAIGAGAPYAIACAAAGISLESFGVWRRRDPEFALKVEKTAAEGAIKRLKKIEEHGKDNFSALAWMLERRYPEHFGRPEVQLNLVNQTNIQHNQFTISVEGAEAVEGAVRELELETGDLFGGRLTESGQDEG